MFKNYLYILTFAYSENSSGLVLINVKYEWWTLFYMYLVSVMHLNGFLVNNIIIIVNNFNLVLIRIGAPCNSSINTWNITQEAKIMFVFKLYFLNPRKEIHSNQWSILFYGSLYGRTDRKGRDNINKYYN